MHTLFLILFQQLRTSKIITALLRRCCCGRSRTQREVTTPGTEEGFRTVPDAGELFLHEKLPNLALVGVVAIMYSALSPLSFVALPHFLLARLVFRYQMIFVHTRIAGKQGALWPAGGG